MCEEKREETERRDEVSLIVKSILSQETIFQEQREPVNCLTELALMEHEEHGTAWDQAFRIPGFVSQGSRRAGRVA